MQRFIKHYFSNNKEIVQFYFNDFNNKVINNLMSKNLKKDYLLLLNPFVFNKILSPLAIERVKIKPILIVHVAKMEDSLKNFVGIINW